MKSYLVIAYPISKAQGIQKAKTRLPLLSTMKELHNTNIDILAVSL